MNRTIEISTNTKLITEECCECGVLFAIPMALRGQLLRTGNMFYCPAGHPQHYRDSTEERLRVANAQLKREKNHNSSLTDQLDGALKAISTKQGQITKLKNRVRAGVCTECHRHFQNLQDHMETKHK